MKKLLLAGCLLASVSTYAVTITVQETSCSGGLTQSQCDQLTAELRSVVNEDLPEVSIDKYATGIANANGFAYKGLGSDYSDIFSYFMVRAAGGLAVQGKLDDAESAEGIGIGASMTAGLNLDLLPIDKVGPIDLSKLDLFVSFMSYNVDQDLDESTAEGDISSLGVMARYRIIDGIDFIPGSLLSWGGVFLHTGFQRSSFELDLTQKFNDETVEISGGQSATLSNASAKFNLESTTTTIPVEVSTYLRAGYIFTLFGGAGFDLVTGSSDASLKASGNAQGDGGASGYGATISANESDSGDADPTNLRAFGGLQFNIPFVRLALQLNKGLGNDLFGVNFGAKILW
ncbi:MAG: hypothetical protein QF441_15985 [Bacteriovoracaceae bacterium]|jgi:hypothetical protein|nr:hypothetical protein [Bacteriovoracaceae bacterium]